MAQSFATTPLAIYNALTGDSEFMSYVGTYTFVSGNTAVKSITITTPGADLPSLKSQSGLEVIIHDAGDIERADYLTDDSDLRVTWKVFFVVWEPASGLTMTNAVKRAMRILGNTRAIETVAVSDGLKANAQTLLLVPTTAPIMTTVDNYLEITSQPGSTSVVVGSGATFSVSATLYDGGNLLYQWQRNTGTGFVNVSGATSNSYTFNTTNINQSGNQFRCIVSSDDTAPSVTSNSATLTVTAS